MVTFRFYLLGIIPAGLIDRFIMVVKESENSRMIYSRQDSQIPPHPVPVYVPCIILFPLVWAEPVNVMEYHFCDYVTLCGKREVIMDGPEYTGKLLKDTRSSSMCVPAGLEKSLW